VFGRVPFPAGAAGFAGLGVAATGAAGSGGGASGPGWCARRFSSSIFAESLDDDCVGRGRLEPLSEIESLSRGAGGGAGGGAGAGAGAGAGFAGSFVGGGVLEHPASASTAITAPHFVDLFIFLAFLPNP
jgi:hypothetical protein